MKLGKPPSSLWVAERRGHVVFVRGGKTGAPGVPKAREHKTDEAAQAFLEAERDKRVADGYAMLDEDAGLDTPFTFDGKPRARSVPARYARVTETLRMHVRAGLRTRDEMASLIDALGRTELDEPTLVGGIRRGRHHLRHFRFENRAFR